MKSALMVAEKPSLAQSLAQILSDGRCLSARPKAGAGGACSVHEWVGQFLGETIKFKMTSVCGHVMCVDFGGVYAAWDKVDPSELFTCPIEKKEATPKLHMPKFLQQEAVGCDYLILWLDCDKEGENICFEVIDAVRSVMKAPLRSGGSRVVFRARFSAITERDIKGAMNNLVDPNENEARSVDARQELDLRIGCAFTRFQTKFFQGKYGNLDSSLISYGPCQTPTLGFCVDRHDFIQSFKPELYWYLQVQATHPSGSTIKLEWDRGRIFDKEVATMFLNMTKGTKEAIIKSVVKTEKTKQRPQALNTVEMMRVASSGLGMGPHHAMNIAEKLYMQGYISYPRTETTHYPENFDLVGTLRQLASSPDWGEYVKELLASGITKPRAGKDVGDHPPITPMKAASFHSLDGDTWKIYDYIARHFIATISPDCKYLQTTIDFQVGSEKFSCTGKTPVDPGFTTVMTWQAISPEESIPICNTGDVYPISEIQLGEGQTSPPSHLTESELITLMEKHGIGTDASIPIHINNIGLRNYVTVESGRRLVPTTLGIVLVHGYQNTDPDLVLPTMRSAVEEQLSLIAHGKADFGAVLRHAIDIFKLKFQYFVKEISGMDQLFEVSFSPLADSGKPMSRCGTCRRYMKFVQTKPFRLHCIECGTTYNVPQTGNIRLYKDKCPLDDFELLQWYGGDKGKSFPFCPYCYNHPPFQDMLKGVGCTSCTHPTCPHSLAANGVCSCFVCNCGIIVLDAASGPKWKFVCNQCDIIIRAFDDALKVMTKEDTCSSCGSQLVFVEYKIDKSKLPDGSATATGCLFCEPQFIGLVEKHHAINSYPQKSRGGGRGRRGGARGRGKRPPKDKMSRLAAYFV